MVINCLARQTASRHAPYLRVFTSNSLCGIKKMKTKLLPSSYGNVTTFVRQNYLINTLFSANLSALLLEHKFQLSWNTNAS